MVPNPFSLKFIHSMGNVDILFLFPRSQTFLKRQNFPGYRHVALSLSVLLRFHTHLRCKMNSSKWLHSTCQSTYMTRWKGMVHFLKQHQASKHPLRRYMYIVNIEITELLALHPYSEKKSFKILVIKTHLEFGFFPWKFSFLTYISKICIKCHTQKAFRSPIRSD